MLRFVSPNLRQPDAKAIRWSFSEMMALIDAIEKRKHIILAPRNDRTMSPEAKRQAWKDIAEELAALHADDRDSELERSYVQCEKKWSAMKKSAVRRKEAYLVMKRKKQKRMDPNSFSDEASHESTTMFEIPNIQNDSMIENSLHDTNSYTNGNLIQVKALQNSTQEIVNSAVRDSTNTELLERLVEGQRNITEHLEKIFNAQIEILTCLKSEE